MHPALPTPYPTCANCSPSCSDNKRLAVTDKQVDRRIRTYICPRCRSHSGIDIVYGMPGHDLVARSERGEIALGGCVTGKNAPDRKCRDCGHEWRITRRSSAREREAGAVNAIGGALSLVLDAASFAAERHRQQRRKDIDASPYINHPLALARILVKEGSVTDPEVITAALLHDTVEDTETSLAELAERFGERVATIVAEVTDDKSQSKAERKRLQVERAGKKSPAAKLVKLADKISNLRDIVASPPAEWTEQRKAEYFTWAYDVVSGLRGENALLETAFDEIYAVGTSMFKLVPDPLRGVQNLPDNPNKGHTFVVDNGIVVADYYHFGEDVDYEFAVQIRFDQPAQDRMAELLELTRPVSPLALAEALRDRFGSYYATRDFADENGISYEARRDMWP